MVNVLTELQIGDSVKIVRAYKNDDDRLHRVLQQTGEVVHQKGDWLFLHFEEAGRHQLTRFQWLVIANRSQVEPADSVSFNDPEYFVKADEAAREFLDSCPAEIVGALVIPLD